MSPQNVDRTQIADEMLATEVARYKARARRDHSDGEASSTCPPRTGGNGALYSKALGRQVQYATEDERQILEQTNELQDVIESNNARLNRKKWFQLR